MESLLFYSPIFFILIMVWQTVKPLPKNINYKSKEYIVEEDDIKFLYDLTVNKTIDQKIVNEIMHLISGAKKYILIDMFLFNSFNFDNNKVYKKLHDQISGELLNKIKQCPNIKIDIITDSINTVYGGGENKEFNEFEKYGINIITTNLKRLRDSNPMYSAIWRGLFQWFGNSKKLGVFPHPFTSGGKKVSLRTYLFLLNLKANHRKIVIVDDGGSMTSIITSANFHNASSTHSNIAIKIRGDFWRELYISERAVAKFSNGKLFGENSIGQKSQKKDRSGKMKITLLTEKKIREGLNNLIRECEHGDVICIGVFYLSDRTIIKNLIGASRQGVKIKIILDPNKDAFGYRKNGIPNRQVASELIRKSKKRIKIKWYNTNGEQFHSKFLFIIKKNGGAKCILGSANFTKRNLKNYNLETDIMVDGTIQMQYFKDLSSYFNKIWNNKNQQRYTLAYDVYEEHSRLKWLIYVLQELTGLSGF